MNYTITLQKPDGDTTEMTLSDASPGPQIAGGARMTGAAIKAAIDAGGSVAVKMFDNDVGLPVLSVEEV